MRCNTAAHRVSDKINGLARFVERGKELNELRRKVRFRVTRMRIPCAVTAAIIV